MCLSSLPCHRPSYPSFIPCHRPSHPSFRPSSHSSLPSLLSISFLLPVFIILAILTVAPSLLSFHPYCPSLLILPHDFYSLGTINYCPCPHYPLPTPLLSFLTHSLGMVLCNPCFHGILPPLLLTILSSLRSSSFLTVLPYYPSSLNDWLLSLLSLAIFPSSRSSSFLTVLFFPHCPS